MLALFLHLLPAMDAGLFPVYVVVGAIAPLLERRLSGELARQLAVAMLGTVVVALLATLIIGAVVAIRHQIGNPETMFDRVMPIIDHARRSVARFDRRASAGEHGGPCARPRPRSRTGIRRNC